jgi:hypothetical protein
MSPYQVVAVALRLVAVWLGIYALRTVVSLAFLRRSETPGLGVAVAFLALTGLLALALWFFPRSIAGKLISPDAANTEASATPDLWLAMGCALLGLWILTAAFPSLVLDTYALVYIGPGADGFELKRSVLYYLSEIVIGLWLVFGAKGFRKLFWWARNAGYNKNL